MKRIEPDAARECAREFDHHCSGCSLLRSIRSIRFFPYSQFVDASPSGCCRSGQEPRDTGINNLEIRIERIERIERRRLQPEQ
jgi:hypothetical protein